MTIHPFSRYVEQVAINQPNRWRVKVCLDWPGVETKALTERLVTGTKAEAEAALDDMIADVIVELRTLLGERT